MSDSFVTLVSNDGYTFVVPRHIVVASETLKAMLDEEAAFQEASKGTAKLHYRGIVVQTVIEYLAHKVQYADASRADILEDFTRRIDPYIALELLTAADYLGD